MKTGFTFIEFIISIAIIAIVAVLVVSGFSSFRESVHLNETQAGILGILRDARTRTLSSEKNTVYGVHFESTKAVLFLGNSYNPNSSSNEQYLLPFGARISLISLGGPVDVVFSRLSGSASASGAITIESTANPSKTKTITIISSGAVE